MAVLSQNKNASSRNLKTFFISKKQSRLLSGTSNAIYSWWSPITLPGYLASLKSVSNNWKRVTITFSRSNGWLVRKEGRRLKRCQVYICLWMSEQDWTWCRCAKHKDWCRPKRGWGRVDPIPCNRGCTLIWRWRRIGYFVLLAFNSYSLSIKISWPIKFNDSARNVVAS